MEDDFYKTMFVASYAPPAIGGGPQVMHTLVKDMPVDSYCILTSFYHIDNISAQKGNWLPGEYLFYDNPKITKATSRTLGVVKQTGLGRDLAARLKTAIRRLPAVAALTGIPVAIGQIWQIVSRGERWAREKGVELLVAVSDYGPALIGTYLLHRQTQLPFYLLMFDIYKGNYFFYPGGNLLASIFEPKLIAAASKIIVNNQGAKDFYIHRYGPGIASKIAIVYNPVDPTPYLKWQNPCEPKPPYTIMFTGRIYWPQIRSLKNMVKAVDGINDLDIRLIIYAPHPPKYIQALGIDSPKLTLTMAPPSEMPQIQSQADILFLPLSWHTKHPDIINTATPGKLTEYLIAGRPMLIHAPADSYLVKYAKANQFAEVVDEESIPDLQAAIRRLLTDPRHTCELVDNAQRTFLANHTAEKNLAAFHSLFAK